MRYASFTHEGRSSWGRIEATAVVDLGAHAPDLRTAIAAGLSEMAVREGGDRIPLAEIGWLPVIPRPDKILCIGINYDDHRRETGRDVSAYPTIFVRFANSQTGHDTAIIRPSASTKLDYEGELAVVIGKPGRHIAPADAMSHVAGYACYMDGSVRDWQAHTQQFTPGKNFPSTGAFGPWLVTPDEVGELATRRLRTRLNGRTVQDAPLGDMIFGLDRLLAYCSTFTRLEPGDVIATGTPGGVGARRDPPLWLKPGDALEIDVEGVGVLRNHVIDEASADE